MLEHLPAGVILAEGSEQTVSYHNRRFAAMFGFALEEFPTLGDLWHLAYPDADEHRRFVTEWNRRLTAASGQSMEINPIESNMTARDGKVWSIRIHATVLDGYSLVMFFDLTNRRKAEEALRRKTEELEERVLARTAELQQANLALREVSERLTLATQAAAMGVWDLDFSNSLVTWDDNMFRLYGLPKTIPMPYETWKQSVHPDDFARVWAFLGQTVANQAYGTIEFRIVRTDGQVRWIAAAQAVLLDEQGDVTRLVGTNTDITERKQMEDELRQSEARHRFLTENMKDVVWILDAETMRFRYHSPSVVRLWGYTPEEMMSKPALETMPPDIRGYLQQQVENRAQAFLSGKASPDTYYTLEFEAPNKAGQPVWVESISRCHLNPVTGHVEIFGVTRDVSFRKNAEKELKASERHFRAFFERPLVGMATISPTTRWLEVNDQLCRMLGYEREELLQKTWQELTFPVDQARTLANIKLILDGETEDFSENKRCLRKDGSLLYAQTSVSCLRKADGSVDYLAVLVVDVTAQHQAQEQLRLAAHHDPLTQLPNRRLLIDRLRQMTAKTRRHGGALAVCYLDLDGFKAVNDKFGHPAGDQLLIEVAKRLKSCVRGGDTVARLGGDEFVILLCNITSAEECRLILQRLLTTIATPYVFADSGQSFISTSVGVTLFPIDQSDPEVLLRHADQALYAAKQGGRGRFVFFNGLDKDDPMMEVEG